MAKKIFIIHRWEGSPESDWYPWLKQELEQKGFDVNVLKMPNPDEPRINEWVPFLKEQVIEPDEDTYFIGHSMGCQAIMRYLETLKDKKIGGVIFVAGFLNLQNLETEEEKELAKHWLETPINLEKVKKTTDNFIAIFSDDDPWVPLSDKDIFERELGAKVLVAHNKGHFTEDNNIVKLPIVIEELMRM